MQYNDIESKAQPFSKYFQFKHKKLTLEIPTLEDEDGWHVRPATEENSVCVEVVLILYNILCRYQKRWCTGLVLAPLIYPAARL